MFESAMTLAQNSGDAAGGIFLILWLAIVVLVIVGFWKVFTKAGQPGWASIIPIYNLYILTKIAGKPWWWVILCFIPIVTIIATAVISIGVAKSFGKGTAYGLGLWLMAPIFYPILGFSDAEYQGPAD